MCKGGKGVRKKLSSPSLDPVPTGEEEMTIHTNTDNNKTQLSAEGKGVIPT